MSTEKKPAKPTITYLHDPYSEYLEKPEYIGSHALNAFMTNPRTYLHTLSKPQPNTKPYQIIEAAYDLIIGTKPFDTKYARLPNYDRRTSLGKENYKTFIEQNEGHKIIITEDQYDLISEVGAYFLNLKWMGDLLRSSHFDLSAYTTDPITGLCIKMRPALLSLDRKTLIDSKLAYKQSTPESFNNQHNEYGYDIGLGLYSMFLPCEKIINLAVEEKAPYTCSMFGYSASVLKTAKAKTRMALDLLKWSMDNNYWCNHAEFEVLKSCYLTKKMHTAYEKVRNSELVISM